MSDCCAATHDNCAVALKQAKHTAVCPSCAKKGKTVDTQTVKAMLAVSLEQIRPSAIYRFCRTPDCPVVYFCDFAAEACPEFSRGAGTLREQHKFDEESHFFTEADLRERVYQKYPTADNVPVCYCFQHTPGTIRAEIMASGKSGVVERITAGTMAGICACNIRNPQGSCCLGNVRVVVKQIAAEFELAPA